MPFINVKTNIPVSENAQEALKTRLGQALSLIHISEPTRP